MATTQLNQLPAPTFSWLGVNGTAREISDDLADEIVIDANDHSVSKIEISQSANVHINGGKEPQFVIEHLHAENAAVKTTIHAESGTHVKLVQIITGGAVIADLQADLADQAALELVQIYLNCADAVSAITVNMNGRKSVFTSNIGYAFADENALDINLNIVQNGKKTESDTAVRGVLRGHAKKIFRGTIDFRNGAAGASGTEQENVLLLDETVVNKTVPVILCAEEDVAGSHGATIGQIDPKHIFYMQSRGIPEAQIYEILAQSQLGSVLKQIGDTETEQYAAALLGREEQDA
ncbi:MAG: SufD family Fe-S cluster assembly protein [Oscillospiraceae bacterium]|nr:SufD family Fe-S cluster assembly protein [Oscillospiraceae bacterium]